jgi:misacylated tRNA(Ala) deacylase
MSRYCFHEHPEVLSVVTRVVDARAGAVVLGDTPFHPGGGGQLADRGVVRWSGERRASSAWTRRRAGLARPRGRSSAAWAMRGPMGAP